MQVTATVDRFRADRVGPPSLPSQTTPEQPVNSKQLTFAEHLQKACSDIGCRTKFSGHASARVDSRGIELTPQQLERIDHAVDSVSEKGAGRALVMLDDMALIVGIEKRTVITLVDQPSLKENVFTSIDAAVIA